MATPMRQLPSRQGQGRTPQASFSQHVASPSASTSFSSSHASFTPHAYRFSPQNVKKSPAVSSVGQPVNATGGFPSPSVAAALSAGLDLNLGNVNLGDLSAALAKNNEDGPHKRLETVILILSKDKGLVSEEGLERLARNLAMDFIWEADEAASDATKTMILAGSFMELHISVTDHIVGSVGLGFPGSASTVNNHLESAQRILLNDLKLQPGQATWTKQMEQFAANLERLATLDSLSVPSNLNLFEAVAGLHESFQTIHKYEMQKARGDPALLGKPDEFLSRLVLCAKSGRPAMHSRRRVGLSLDYWLQKRFLFSSNPETRKPLDDDGKTWSLLIGCTPIQDVVREQPVRVSEKWVSIDVGNCRLPVEIDWQEPDPTLIPPGTLPNVTFTATFDPPVYIPFDLWQTIQTTGITSQRPLEPSQVYHRMVIPKASSQKSFSIFTNTPVATVRRKILRFDTSPSGQTVASTRIHHNSLFVQKPVYGFALTTICFSHPRQLTDILPFARQYAFLGTILENSFGDRPDEPLLDQNDTDLEGNLQVDLSLYFTSQGPILRLQFPFKGRPCHVLFEISLNGQVHVKSQNVLTEQDTTRPEQLGIALEKGEDLGTLCEIIRKKLG